MKYLVTSLALVATFGLAGCGSSSDSTGTPATTSTDSSAGSPSAGTSSAGGSGAQQSAMITISDYKFSGANTVTAGTQVTVKNTDQEAHTVTADDGKSFDVTIDPGKTATFMAPMTAGKYAYHCTYHSNMHGSLTVS